MQPMGSPGWLEMAREEREVEEPERPEHITRLCLGVGRPHSSEEAV